MCVVFFMCLSVAWLAHRVAVFSDGRAVWSTALVRSFIRKQRSIYGNVPQAGCENGYSGWTDHSRQWNGNPVWGGVRLKIRPEKQIAEVLNLSRSQIQKMMRKGEMEIEKISPQTISVYISARNLQ